MESFERRDFEFMIFLIVSFNFLSSFGGTRRPVLPSLIISGMPPVRVAIIGSPEIIASRFTRPNASRMDGRMKK